LVEVRNSFENGQAGASGALSIIFVCFGIAEKGHHPVTQVLSDVATEALDRDGRHAMIRGDDVAPFLRVELSRDLG
jgi:hypothetical protein